MNRKNKSVKQTTQLLKIQRQRYSNSKTQTFELKQKQKELIASSILEEILMDVQSTIDYSRLACKEMENIAKMMGKFDSEYFQCGQLNECTSESYTCQPQPIKFNQILYDFKKNTDRRSIGMNANKEMNKSILTKMRWSKSKTKSCDVFTNSKSLEKYKQQREALKHCSKNQILPLVINSVRNSEDYTQDYSQQIEKLLRRKNDLLLRTRIEQNLISSSTTNRSMTDRKEKKMFYQNDEGRAFELLPTHTPRQLSQRLEMEVKNLHGKTIYGGLKKKPIVQYSAGKKTKRRKDVNIGETCVLIQQMKEIENYAQSLTNNTVIKLKKGIKLKLNRQFDQNQINLPQIR